MSKAIAAVSGADPHADAEHIAFEKEVIERVGIVPNFFRSASDAPELMSEFWSFMRSAYLDNPLPRLFKGRLVIHLSRFCEARYCVVRHVSSLLGQPTLADVAGVASPTLDQTVRLLRRPGVPAGSDLDSALSRLEAYPTPILPPDPETQEEQDVFAVATVLFLEPARSARARIALRTALGGRTFEFLTACLSFVRMTHYWVLTHPEIPFDEDMDALLSNHQELARLLLSDPESSRCDMGERLFDELVLLRREREEREELKRALAERERAQKHQLMLINELNHRVKNTLSIVQSLAAQTMRGSGATEPASEAFTMRLMALAQAHDMLTNKSWQGADLRDLIAQAASIHGDGLNRIKVEGPPVQLSPKMTLSLSMAIHELTTNAIKYGALSNETGYVEVSWGLVPDPADVWLQLRLKLRWEEIGGPPVVPPSRKGFGSRLIERGLAGELAGEVRMVYERAGVVCMIEAPLPKVE